MDSGCFAWRRKINGFNNGIGRPGGNFSSIDEIELPVNENGNYASPGTGSYLPKSATWQYIQDTATNFYSNLISGAQRLPNGNTLICEGVKGKLFEIDSAGNKVWQYINPVTNNGIISQGDSIKDNNVFRAYKYGENYPAFKNKTLTPQGYVEKDPWTYNCSIFKDSTIGISDIFQPKQLHIYPNPNTGLFNIHNPYNGQATLYLYDYSGKEVFAETIQTGTNIIQLNTIKPGIYFCRITGFSGTTIHSLKIVKM